MLAFNTRFIAPQLRQQLTRNFYAMETTETMATEVIESDWYTFRELQLELARHRGKGVPDRTLQWWTQQLCISTNAYGFYELQDLRLLVRLVYWLKRNRSLAKFKTLLLQELETHAQTLEKQDGRPHVVLDPFRASAPANTTQAPLASPATALVGVGEADCKSRARATEKTLLCQRLERLEAITTKLAQRLALLEQRSLPPRALPLQPYPINSHQPCPEPSQDAHPPDARPPARSPAESSKAQSVATASVSSPSQSLVTLTPADWTRGLVTKHLVERLQTNPTTLKKYLRNLKQIQWAVQRDPEGFGWVYDPLLQSYYPKRMESDGHGASPERPTAAVKVEALPAPTRSNDIEPKCESTSVKPQQHVGTGGLYQSALSRLTGIPITTLQQWKQRPDCAERMRCRTEGRYCYWYARQTKRFYPLNSPADFASGAVTATEI